MSNKIIKTRTDTVFLRSDGIVQIETMDGADFDYHDAVDAVNAFAQIAGGVMRPLLLKFELVKSISREARGYLSSEAPAKYTNACAILTNSPIGRVIGNFLIGLNKTIYPTRLFNTEEEAIEWLKNFKI